MECSIFKNKRISVVRNVSYTVIAKHFTVLNHKKKLTPLSVYSKPAEKRIWCKSVFCKIQLFFLASPGTMSSKTNKLASIHHLKFQFLLPHFFLLLTACFFAQTKFNALIKKVNERQKWYLFSFLYS